MPAPRVDAPLGTVLVNERPHSFYDSGGNVWLNWWSGSEWLWQDQGPPPGAGVFVQEGDLPCAVTVEGRPHIFLFAPNDLWAHWWTGGSWAWRNLGHPPGLANRLRMGAVTTDSGCIYVFVNAFVRTNVFELWTCWWSGSDWAWERCGSPQPGIMPIGPLGATVVDGTRPHVFVGASDNNVWVYHWTDAGWIWTNLGRGDVLPGRAVGAVTIEGNRPHVFLSSGLRTWVAAWSGSWQWHDLGAPRGITNGKPLGATVVSGSRPYVFFQEWDTENIWLLWWTGTRWDWELLGRPPNARLDASGGVVAVDGTRPHLFIKDVTGGLWLLWWTGADWRWQLQE